LVKLSTLTLLLVGISVSQSGLKMPANHRESQTICVREVV
jgi:hypothetical protein